MCNFRIATMFALMTLAALTATVNPSQADTGTVHVLFSKAGVIAAVGNGTGVLTFHGKKYPFEVYGASFGATLELSVSEFVGRALNLRSPGDLAGTYTAAGAGGALVAGFLLGEAFTPWRGFTNLCRTKTSTAPALAILDVSDFRMIKR